MSIGGRVLMHPPLSDYAADNLLQATQVNAARQQFVYELEKKFPWSLSPTVEVWAKVTGGQDVQITGRKAPANAIGYYLVSEVS
jgi:hypothetical protein